MRTSILLLLIVGCQTISPKTEPVNNYFDLPSFAQNLLLNQVAAPRDLTKIVQVNGEEETLLIQISDSLFWAKELSPMLRGTINKPSLTDAYLIEENVPDELSNLLVTTYTLKPEVSSSIKLLEVKYLNTFKDIRQIHALVENINSVYSTQVDIHLWLNQYGDKLLVDSLVTTGFNKTIFLDSMKYTSTVSTN